MHPYQLNLDNVAAEFEKWRQAKLPHEKIPARLWSLVKEIVEHYPRGKLCSALRLSVGQLRSRGLLPAAAISSRRPANPAEKVTFVQVPAAPIQEPEAHALLTVNLSRESDGSLTIRTTNSHVIELLLLTLGGTSTCSN